MAFRIHDRVVRGEIDNRLKGIVRGKIWVEGRAEPVVLELKGNAWPDLAGCFLTFVNPLRRVPHPGLDSLHSLQQGSIGDLTASRKVRVFDVPVKEALEMYRRKQKPPEHLANSLYLEWFSEANGRVVIESAVKFHQQVDAASREKLEDQDLEQFIFEFQTTSAKLAGALNSFARGQAFRDAAFTTAYLKRALNHLHKSQAGLETVAPKKLLPDSMIADARKELFEIREGILRLMDEFRGRK